MNGDPRATLAGLEKLHGRVISNDPAAEWLRLTEEHDAIPGLTAALRAVLDLRQRAHETGPTSCVECNKGRKFVEWPCPTVTAITTALGGQP